MSRNVGTVDRYVRIVVGLALVAFAFQNGLSIQGWHWLGLAGFVLLATALFRSCPAYSVLGCSTRCTAREASRARLNRRVQTCRSGKARIFCIAVVEIRSLAFGSG